MTAHPRDPMAKAEAALRRRAEKALEKREARKARKSSPAVEAGIWDDRDGKARPTAERRAKGAFVLRDGEDAGVTVAVDEAATVLDRLARRGIVTSDQRDAGHDFAALMQRTQLTKQGRSCLNFDPVGYDDSEPTHAEMRDAAERWRLYMACGAEVWREMRRVCCDGEPVRSLDRLRAGLDHCVKMWA